MRRALCLLIKITTIFSCLIVDRTPVLQALVQGELFGMSQPVANKWIHRLLPVLNGALAELGELPSRETSPVSFDVPADTSTDNQVSEHFS